MDKLLSESGFDDGIETLHYRFSMSQLLKSASIDIL